MYCIITYSDNVNFPIDIIRLQSLCLWDGVLFVHSRQAVGDDDSHVRDVWTISSTEYIKILGNQRT